MDQEKDISVNSLKGFQSKYLRGLAHKLKPVVIIGQRGVTESLIDSLNQALANHELIKIKFIDFKEKEIKKAIILDVEQRTGAKSAGMIGHTAILFRPHEKKEKRKIRLPEK
jgi:RNA-binding protein